MFDLFMDTHPAITLISDKFKLAGVDIRSYREPLMRSVRQVLAPELREAFANQGPGWAPLHPNTVRRKGHNRILFESGTLARMAGQISAWSVDRTSARLTEFPDYGEFHITGTEHMPARPWNEISYEAEADIEQIFKEWCEERLRRRGLL